MSSKKKAMGPWSAISIGIGGMIGAGIFSILGFATEMAGSGVIVSFIVAGLVAFLCAYSYSKLGVKYPSAGGAVEFLVKGFGTGVLSGGFNILLWLAYIIAISLYASAFAAYGLSFFPGIPWYFHNIVASAIILVFLGVNFIGAQAVGKSEIVIVLIKVVILVIFAAIGLLFVDQARLGTGNWSPPSHMFLAAGMVFIAYQGFGLITNTAEDMRDVDRTLPKSLYLCIIIVMAIYLAVSVTVVGNLDPAEIVEAEDYALAEAAKPFLGQLGFVVMAIAALFSTSSAINATLYGGANVSYIIAKEGELPAFFERKLWHGSREGLFITTGVVLLFVNVLDLEGIAMLGSASFLLIYMAVNIAHMRLYKETGARPGIVVLAVIGCLVSLLVLVYFNLTTNPMALVVFVFVVLMSFLIEWIYRSYTDRELRSDGLKRKTPKYPRIERIREEIREEFEELGMGLEEGLEYIEERIKKKRDVERKVPEEEGGRTEE